MRKVVEVVDTRRGEGDTRNKREEEEGKSQLREKGNNEKGQERGDEDKYDGRARARGGGGESTMEDPRPSQSLALASDSVEGMAEGGAKGVGESRQQLRQPLDDLQRVTPPAPLERHSSSTLSSSARETNC